MSWDSWEKTVEKGPWAVFIRLFFFIVAASVLMSIVWWGISWFSISGQVAQDEFNTRTLLKRYNWFKDCAAILDARYANIKLRESFIRKLEILRNDPNTDAENRRSLDFNINLFRQELNGIKSSYNNLAAEYNSAMAKDNWRFCNVGNLPLGGKVLEREYKVYLDE